MPSASRITPASPAIITSRILSNSSAVGGDQAGYTHSTRGGVPNLDLYTNLFTICKNLQYVQPAFSRSRIDIKRRISGRALVAVSALTFSVWPNNKFGFALQQRSK